MKRKTIGLVAHDNRKKDLIEWVEHNSSVLCRHKLICTGTTGKLVIEKLTEKKKTHEVIILKSGPLGGDQELGSLIANSGIDVLIFLIDPMSIQPHDVDIKALLRLAVLYNIPSAYNRSTADYIISSDLFSDIEYKPIIKDYTEYMKRSL
jgi:methylglyoxal synthase